ncbi:MAG: histone deacetylase [Vicinamibacteraceae bacterium]|nr:histone deacetylase [Vicinamibacteraceae bacterium]
MRIAYSPRYHVDLGAHVFRVEKYRRVVEELRARGIATDETLVEPPPASWEELEFVHTAAYLAKLRNGTLTTSEVAQLELPWSADGVEAFRMMTGGTILAARMALEDGLAAQVGGGLHHAFPGHGEGFCMFNDVAVATRVLRREARVRRVVVLDCDVHQGNGTAAIFAGDPDVFTISMHQTHNYPAEKPPSRLDIELDDGTGDEEYLARLETALAAAIAHQPDLAFYLAGADPYFEDQLGGLALTRDGLRARDARVLSRLRRQGVPTVVALAGGYAHRLEDTVAIHVATLEEAFVVWRLVSSER